MYFLHSSLEEVSSHLFNSVCNKHSFSNALYCFSISIYQVILYILLIEFFFKVFWKKNSIQAATRITQNLSPHLRKYNTDSVQHVRGQWCRQWCSDAALGRGTSSAALLDFIRSLPTDGTTTDENRALNGYILPAACERPEGYSRPFNSFLKEKKLQPPDRLE